MRLYQPGGRSTWEALYAWTNAHTTLENKIFLGQLGDKIPLELGSLKVLLVHGSPRKINEYLYEDRPDATMEHLLDLAGADVLVCGHTHIPYHRGLPSGGHVINAGSVGKSKDSNPRACYIKVSERNSALEVEFIRVAYDIARAADAIRRTEMPYEFAAMLEVGRG